MNKNVDFVHLFDVFIDEGMTYKEVIFTILVMFFIVFFMCYGFISFIFDFINLFS